MQTRFAMASLLAGLVAVEAGCTGKPLPPARIEVEAILAIDRSEVDPAVIDFLQQATENRVQGQPVTSFATLMQLAVRDPNNPSFYEVALPSTPESRRWLSARHGTDCLPVLLIEVLPTSNTIHRVAATAQCL